MARIGYSDVMMGHRVGATAARVVRTVIDAGGDLDLSELIDMVYEKLDDVFGKVKVERETDRYRVQDAVKIAIRLETGV